MIYLKVNKSNLTSRACCISHQLYFKVHKGFILKNIVAYVYPYALITDASVLI